ncbi:Tetraspanin family-domain-containing protein [Chytriomyces sp. MP71]|nr:Tetraspanin family-domain-containing protein [Chytriomyces sp. MP71]
MRQAEGAELGSVSAASGDRGPAALAQKESSNQPTHLGSHDCIHTQLQMYQYSQYRHESKKWFSRVYLVFINTVLLTLSVFVMIGGWVVYKIASDNVNVRNSPLSHFSHILLTVDELHQQYVSESVVGLPRGVGLALLIVGAFILLTTIAGSIGACTRDNRALKPYMAIIGLVLLATACGGIYFLVKLEQNAANWSSLTIDKWNSDLNDYHRDMYQSIYACCGFDDKHTGAYTGAPLFDVDRRKAQECAVGSQYLSEAYGCLSAGNGWYRVYTIISGSVFAALLLVLLTAIGAADNARERASDIGYQVSYEAVPLTHKA